ncbi:MAG: ABC transporter permease [Fimbriimonas sp.]|nr:ABC transporter permease [Fimbriimonas sp.]
MEFISLLQYSAPVALAAIGEIVVQQSGVIDIGLEGSMLVGSYFGMLTCLATHNPWLGLGAAILAALLLTLLFGVFTVLLAADQVVVGTAVNLFAMGLTSALFRSKFGGTMQLISIPRLGAYHGIDLIMVGMLVSVPAVWYLMRRTAWGLAVRSCGEYPKSAEAAGFSVYKLRLQALAIGGLFAGLSGAYLSLVIAGSFAENMTAGRGFVAIAMVTFGRWKPHFAFLAALLVGFADSLQYRFQTYGWHVPFQLMIAMPYIVALAVLVLVGKGTAAPGALAQPYRMDK